MKYIKTAIKIIASILWLIGLSLPTGLFNAPKSFDFPGDSFVFLTVYIASFVYMILTITSYFGSKNAPEGTTTTQKIAKNTAKLAQVRSGALGALVMFVLLVLVLSKMSDGAPESEWGASVGLLFLSAAAAFVCIVVALVTTLMLLGKKK